MNRFKEISAELTRRGDLLREKYPKRSSMDLIGELFMSCKTDDERDVCLQLKHRHVKEFQKEYTDYLSKIANSKDPVDIMECCVYQDYGIDMYQYIQNDEDSNLA